MQGTVSKWGNSLAVRLPRHLADQARLTDGSAVDLDVVEGILTITPARKKMSLAELLECEPKRAAAPAAETDWGPAQGEEVW